MVDLSNLPVPSSDPSKPDVWGAKLVGAITALNTAKAENSTVSAKADKTYVDTSLTTKADLVGGKLSTSQLPSVSLSGEHVPVANQAARLALTSAQVQGGDIATQADNGIDYMLVQNGNPASNSDWLPLGGSAGGVLSVNGVSAPAVVLTKADIGLGNVPNTAAVDLPVSTAQSQAIADAVATRAPSTNIAKTALSAAVQTSLGKADTALQAAAIGTSIAGLTAGKLDPGVIPSLAITSVTPVASQADMLALVVEVGDVAIRTDDNDKAYILSALPATTLANWKPMGSASAGVSTVAGLTGSVTAPALKTALALTATDVSGVPPVSTAWAASTPVKTGQFITQAGVPYVSNADFTTGTTFSATNFTPLSLGKTALLALLGIARGTSTQNGDGTKVAFTIAHGLGVVPASYAAIPTSDAAVAPYKVTADATNLTVTLAAAPAAGTGNVVLTWMAFA